MKYKYTSRINILYRILTQDVTQNVYQKPEKQTSSSLNYLKNIFFILAVYEGDDIAEKYITSVNFCSFKSQVYSIQQAADENKNLTR